MVAGPRIGSLFSGYGGLEQGVQRILGGEAVWHSEIDPGASRILAHRYPGVPNHGDITQIDWADVEPVDVLTGGFPCQDVSAVGLRKGMRPGTRSGLFTHFAYAIQQLRPELVVIENVRGLLSADAHHPAHSNMEPCPWCVGGGPSRPLRALGAVLGQLADLGYNASWQGLRASDVGAPHGRFRVFIVAWPATDTERGGRDGRPRAAGPGRWVELADGGDAAADTRGIGGERRGGHGSAAAHSNGRECAGREQEAQRGEVGGVSAARVGRSCDGGKADKHKVSGDLSTLRDEPSGVGRLPSSDWGPYADAVARWERLTGPSPAPTEPGGKGQPRLSPAFVEWMMGLPVGWVTQVPGLSRNEQLKALGNGVVPQQAAEALRLLLPDVEAPDFTPAGAPGPR